MIRIAACPLMVGLFLLSLAAHGGESPHLFVSVSVQFTDADGHDRNGEIIAHNIAGFTLKTADGEITFRWDALGPETSFNLYTKIIPETDGQAWLNAAYRLETMTNGQPWADRALDKAVAAEPALSRAAEALRTERAWFAQPAPLDEPVRGIPAWRDIMHADSTTIEGIVNKILQTPIENERNVLIADIEDKLKDNFVTLRTFHKIYAEKAVAQHDGNAGEWLATWAARCRAWAEKQNFSTHDTLVYQADCLGMQAAYYLKDATSASGTIYDAYLAAIEEWLPRLDEIHDWYGELSFYNVAYLYHLHAIKVVSEDADKRDMFRSSLSRWKNIIRRDAIFDDRISRLFIDVMVESWKNDPPPIPYDELLEVKPPYLEWPRRLLTENDFKVLLSGLVRAEKETRRCEMLDLVEEDRTGRFPGVPYKIF